MDVVNSNAIAERCSMSATHCAFGRSLRVRAERMPLLHPSRRAPRGGLIRKANASKAHDEKFPRHAERRGSQLTVQRQRLL
eukprot:47318-Eustigmatos_ZCMA.PRE.1